MTTTLKRKSVTLRQTHWQPPVHNPNHSCVKAHKKPLSTPSASLLSTFLSKDQIEELKSVNNRLGFNGIHVIRKVHE